MMTALLLYSYCQGIYSSRRIARACRQLVDYMALTGMQKPDFRTVNLFRQRHLKALEGLFEQVLDLCRKAGLVQLGHVALDGTRIRANANKNKTMRYDGIKKAEQQIQAEVRRWFEEAERIDREEDEQYGADRRGDELPDWVMDKQKRAEKLRQARAELEAEAKQKAEAEPDPNSHKAKPTGKVEETASRNLTDLDSRLMRTTDGLIAGYNAQAAVDSASQVIVAQTLTNNSADMGQMIPLLDQIRKNIGKQAKEVSADAGYCSAGNLKTLSQRRIRGFVATIGQKRPRNNAWVYQMHQRLAKAARRSRFRLRRQTVEPVFGQIKSARGFRQFLLRGLRKVTAEWSLLCTAHNLLKLAAAVR
jgi:hypothetical protein